MKATNLKLSIKTKSILISVSVIILVVSILSIFFLFRERSLVRDNIIHKTEILVDRLGSVVRDSWFSNERDLTLLDTIQAYNNTPYLTYIFIYDDKGNIVAQGNSRYLKWKNAQILSVFEKSFPERIRLAQKNYTKKDGPLISDWQAKELFMMDFYLPIYHRLHQNQLIATVRLGVSTEEIRKKTQDTTITILSISSILLIIGIGLGFLQGWYFARPIVQLKNHAIELGKGDFSIRIDMLRSDELGDLANAFNIMSESLEEGEKIKLDKARIDEQIGLAKEIQEGLNPSQFYQKNGLEIKGYTKAAKGIGGDYFDFMDVDKDHVAVLVSDVSGKDIPASLIMIMIRTVLTTLLKTNLALSPSIIVHSINQIMASDFAMDKFATMLFLMINRRTGDLFFSNAGHNPVLIYRAALKECTHIPLDGLPIGVDEDSEYGMGHTILQPGDITLLYSDGVTEAWNNVKEEYQKTRLLKQVRLHHALNAKEINAKIIEDIALFVGDAAQHDDTTLVVVKKTEYQG